MADGRIENARSDAELEYAIREIHSKQGFGFTDKEWGIIAKAGYDKLDVARLCCENAVEVEVESYNRSLIVAWDNGPCEESVLAMLEHRYEQWVEANKRQEDPFRCEEWMIDGLTGFSGFEFFVIYKINNIEDDKNKR